MKILTLMDDAGTKLQIFLQRDGSCVDLELTGEYFGNKETLTYYFNDIDDIQLMIDELKELKEALKTTQ